ncbi:MAG: hypothetical protein HQK49_09090 [Oligoflexia bacterium]|nr:hypothetical protein [Oligoflexia bacterium]
MDKIKEQAAVPISAPISAPVSVSEMNLSLSDKEKDKITDNFFYNNFIHRYFGGQDVLDTKSNLTKKNKKFLDGMIKKLPDREWLVIALLFWKKKSIIQISEHISAPIAEVKLIYESAIDRLRGLIVYHFVNSTFRESPATT